MLFKAVLYFLYVFLLYCGGCIVRFATANSVGDHRRISNIFVNTNQTILYVVYHDGSIQLSSLTSSGSWTSDFIKSIDSPAATQAPVSFAANEDGRYLAALTPLNLFVSNDYGLSWSSPPSLEGTYCMLSFPYYFVTMSLSGKIVYVSCLEKLFRSTDYGQTFSFVWSSTDQAFIQLQCDSTGRRILILSKVNFLYSSSNYGVSFESLTLTSSSYYPLLMFSADSALQTILGAPVPSGLPTYVPTQLYISKDFGETWSQKDMRKMVSGGPPPSTGGPGGSPSATPPPPPPLTGGSPSASPPLPPSPGSTGGPEGSPPPAPPSTSTGGSPSASPPSTSTGGSPSAFPPPPPSPSTAGSPSASPTAPGPGGGGGPPGGGGGGPPGGGGGGPPGGGGGGPPGGGGGPSGGGGLPPRFSSTQSVSFPLLATDPTTVLATTSVVLKFALDPTGRNGAALRSNGELFISLSSGFDWTFVSAPVPSIVHDLSFVNLLYDATASQISLLYHNKVFISHDGGVTISPFTDSSPCSNGFYGDTCNDYCNGDDGYYSQNGGGCQRAPEIYCVSGITHSSVFVGTGLDLCSYPRVSYYYLDLRSSKTLYYGCKPRTKFVSYAVNLKVPWTLLIVIAGFLVGVFILCHLWILDKNGEANWQIAAGLLYYTLLPAIGTISDLIVLFRGEWGTLGLLVGAAVFLVLPDFVFYYQLWRKNARAKFWIYPMPSSLFFQEYDSFYKVAITGVVGFPFFLLNAPFLIPWLLLGTYLFKMKVMCIGRVQEIWFRVWTGNSHWTVPDFVDEAQLNEQFISILLLQSLPWLILQAVSIHMVSGTYLTYFSMSISALMLLSGAYRYGYYVLHKKLRLSEVPVRILGFGIEQLSGKSKTKLKTPMCHQVLPMIATADSADQNNYELDRVPSYETLSKQSTAYGIPLKDLEFTNVSHGIQDIYERCDGYDEKLRSLSQSYEEKIRSLNDNVSSLKGTVNLLLRQQLQHSQQPQSLLGEAEEKKRDDGKTENV
jgi:hypothetical protein